MTAILLSSIAKGGPTGLNAMPTAHLMSHREISLQYSLSHGNSTYCSNLCGAVGLFDVMEFGADSDLKREHSHHAKLQLLRSPKWARGLTASVGYCCARGGYCEPYAVLSMTCHSVNVHAGYWRTVSTNAIMVGADFEASKNSTAMIEYISGPNGASWIGLYYDLPTIPGLNIGAAIGFPNRPSEGRQHTIAIGYSFKL